MQAANLPKIVFSNWAGWTERMFIDRISAPGVYLLAHFKRPLVGEADPQTKETIYIGETCAQSLKQRWGQFHRCAFEEKKGHSGGVTYWQLFAGKRSKSLYVAAFPVAKLDDEIRPLFIRYVERKLLLDYALKWGTAPICNKK